MKGRFEALVTMTANAKTNFQPAYIVHSRAYRDTSLLLEAFTAEHGRISLVARGARQSGRRGSDAALLQPFRPLLISFSGRSDLKTLSKVEAAGMPAALRGERMYSGLYLNELIVRLLHPHHPHPQLFAQYSDTLSSLVGTESIEDSLRRFELALLDDLGYQLVLTEDSVSGAPLQDDAWYRYFPGQGLQLAIKAGDMSAGAAEGFYLGKHLLALAEGNFETDVRRTAKQLLREVLMEHLGGKPLHSRELFRANSGRTHPPLFTTSGIGG
jgi:DNA repair protein RecO (recombination protein O)